jgi:hypothetical protein
MERRQTPKILRLEPDSLFVFFSLFVHYLFFLSFVFFLALSSCAAKLRTYDVHILKYVRL